ncbi:GyrI-like domain-containing protein [Cupriavidus sp. 2TAF22]|uniref:GyrI-like domain-containing protein n=1 Tax=unclassified Cupriavidus TaxID=2640874 RepID=UPI003F8F5E96
MTDPKAADLSQPRFETGRPLLIAGQAGRFTLETNGGIPALWQRFIPQIGKVPGQVGYVTYGVCCNPDGHGGFEYIAGVEVGSLDGLQEAYRCIELAAQHYAVFTHAGPLSTLVQTCLAIWQKWLPASGLETACAPDFERYSADFDPAAGTGVVEVWVPLKARPAAAA